MTPSPIGKPVDMTPLAEFSQVVISPPLPFREDKRNVLRTVPVLALYAGLMAGTAGAFTPANVSLVTNIAILPLSEIRPV